MLKQIQSYPDNTTSCLYDTFPIDQTFSVNSPQYCDYDNCNMTIFRFDLSYNRGNECTYVVGSTFVIYLGISEYMVNV